MPTDGSSLNETEQYVVTGRQAQLNGSTFHRGTREDGAECGQVADSWAQFEAVNPIVAVAKYAHTPCSSCFGKAYALSGLYRALHTNSILDRDPDEIASRLPWEVPDGTW